MLLVRAGALGDLLLLRRAIASLRVAGHGIGLLGPAGPGSALVGPGAADVEHLLPWDRAEVATLLTRAGVPPGPLAVELGGFQAAIAYTRSETLAHSLERAVGRVLRHDPVPPPGRHAADWLTEAVAPLAAVWSGPVPEPEPTIEEAARALSYVSALPDGFVAVHPGSGSPAKNWPAARFAELVAALAGRGRWLLVDGPADEAATAPLRGLPGAVPASGVPPRVLGAVLARAGVFVGHDSGVSHLAAAWGAPTVALFGPTDPEVWRPLGPRVRVVRSATGTMSGIALAEVLAATRALAGSGV